MCHKKLQSNFVGEVRGRLLKDIPSDIKGEDWGSEYSHLSLEENAKGLTFYWAH